MVTNNGPSVLDSEVTFSAVLLHYEPRHQLSFVFDDGKRQSERAVSGLNVTVVYPFPSSIYEEKSYTMKVTVYSDNFFFKETVVSNSSRFDLKSKIKYNSFVCDMLFYVFKLKSKPDHLKQTKQCTKYYL